MDTTDSTTDGTLPGTGFPAPDGMEPEERPEEARPVSYLVFPAGGYGLMVDQTGEMEFLENQVPFHIPNSHPRFRGLINRRGSLVPVFDIRSMLDDQPRINDDGRVLILGSGDDAVGINLDSVPYRASITEEQRTAPPVRLTQVFGECLGECYLQGGSIQALVQMDRFLYKLAHDSNA